MDEKETLEEAKKALNVLRDVKEKLDKGLVTQATFDEVAQKTNAVIDKQEELAQKALATENANKKLEEDLKNLEESFLRAGAQGAGSDYKNSELYKSYKAALKNGDFAQYEQIATKALNRTDIQTDGGYLVPMEMSREIIKDITEISPMRQLARVMTIGSKSIQIPRRRSLLQAQFEGETETNTSDTSTYGTETLTPYALSVTVPVTWDILNNVPDFENEVMMDVSESFAQAEGNAFLNGDGNKKPEGILTNTDINSQSRETAASLGLGFDDVINITGDLKSGYDGMYTFNRQVNAYLRTLKGSDGHYLWQMQSEGNFNTLNGFKYMLDNQMPDFRDTNGNAVAGRIPILFGDFMKGYRIIDRTDMMVIRDDYTQKNNRIVEFAFHRWCTGKVVLPEAIRALKIKA